MPIVKFHVAFRLRDDGIKNKSLLDHERKNDRKVEHTSYQLLSITESVFWLLGKPYVFTKMSFIHIRNVFVELRCVGARLSTESDDQLSSCQGLACSRLNCCAFQI